MMTNNNLSEVEHILYGVVNTVIEEDEKAEKEKFGEIVINFTEEDKQALVDRVMVKLDICTAHDFYKLLAEKADFITDIVYDQTNIMLDEKDEALEME